MTDRLDTIKHLAQTDEYWRAYLDGMFDKRGIRDEPTCTRERLHAYYDASAAMGDDADPEDSRRWLQEARKRRSR